MSRATPLRHPDTSSPGEMTARGWWLAGLNILLPGTPQLVAGNRVLGRVGILGVS